MWWIVAIVGMCLLYDAYEKKKEHELKLKQMELEMRKLKLKEKELSETKVVDNLEKR